MDGEKLKHKSTIGILDPTRVNQGSHTVVLSKDSEKYKGMTKKQFKKEVAEQSSKARAKVSLYIAKAMHAFMNDGKNIIKIPYFFK